MKDSFVVYTEWKKYIGKLTSDQKADLLDAIFDYQSGDDVGDLDQATEIVFEVMRNRFDIDTAKWEEVCEKRREAGKMGGRPKKADASSEKQKKAKKANGFSEKQTKAKKPEYEYEYEYEYESDNKATPYEYIVQLFRSNCTSLPNIRSLSKQRKAQIRNLLKTYTVDDFETVFRKAEGSDFLSGRSGKWQCGFDWLIKPSNFLKVLEGNYDNKDKNDALKKWAEGDTDGQEADSNIIDIPAFFVS